MAYTHITPGWKIEVSAHYYFDKKTDRIMELIQLPQEELTAMEAASVKREEAIFSRFFSIEDEWKKQAAETVALRKAREYLRALPVEHTSNQWKTNQAGWQELSNMVYKLSYRIEENKKPDGRVVNYKLSWQIHYNTLQHPTPDLIGSGWQFGGQRDKIFAARDELDRYLQGRIKAYSHLFTEISPPIPKDQKGRFCVNGVLLPGYTVEVTAEERLEELLSFLDDDLFPAEAAPPPDTPDTPQSDIPQEEEPADVTYHPAKPKPEPGACSQTGHRPERAKEAHPSENGPGPVTAAFTPLSAPAWHLVAQMPLVRGKAPKTPLRRNAPQYEGHFKQDNLRCI